MRDRTPVIDRLISEAARTKVRMPFERGAPRAAFIARRRWAEETASVREARARISASARRFDIDQAVR